MSGGNERWGRPLRRGRQGLRVVRVVATRTVRDTLADRVPTLAGGVAFFTLLSLPFALLAFLGGVSFLAQAMGPDVAQRIREEILGLSRTFLTESTVVETVEPVVDDLLEEGRGGILSFGILLTLWSASRAAAVMIEALVVAYDLEEYRRSGLKRRLLAYGLSAGGIAAGVVIFPVLVAGPELGRLVAEPLGLATVFGTVWTILYWPLVVAAGVGLLATFYHLASPIRTPWRRDLPGAILAALVWILAGIGLRLYATRVIVGSDSVFGPLAAPVVLLLWLYVTAMAVLVGAELNAELGKLWPRTALWRGVEAGKTEAQREPVEAGDASMMRGPRRAPGAR